MHYKILIVEDETILREIVKDYLVNDGHEVTEAIDGEQALELFQKLDFHLIILDIMLPKVDGWAVCRRIRKTSNVPIIMLTARADEARMTSQEFQTNTTNSIVDGIIDYLKHKN